MKQSYWAQDEWEQEPRRGWRWLRWLLVILGTGVGLTVIGALLAVVVIYNRLAVDLPAVEELETYQPSLGTEVYDRREQLIAEFFIERRRLVPLEEVPLHVRQATVAAEDSRFYTHSGVDFIGILRAVWVNFRAGETREGASTITQQVARNLFLTRDRTVNRKIREAILARRIEKVYSKDRILQIYLNQIFYGHNAYGIEAAAQLYFGKSVKDLSLTEGALIAGLPPAPNVYSPLKNLPRSLQRRDHVLRRMAEEGHITPEQAQAATREAVALATTGPSKKINKAPYFVEHIRQYLEEKFGPNELYRGGFQVYTTLDMPLQRAAEHALRTGLLPIDKRTRKGVYYGPGRHLELTKDEDENKLLIDTVTLPEDGNTSVVVGELLPAVVLEVKGSDVLVQVKDSRGRITPAGMGWIRAIDSGGTQRRRTSPGQFLRRGDVVRVRVSKVAPQGSKHELALEQDPAVQGALLAMEVGSGHVLAMVGGYDFAASQFNRATQAQRQPGSSFKPIIYAAGLEAGLTPTSIVSDNPITRSLSDGKVWRPHNYDGTFMGSITLRRALTQSRNLATIDVLEKVGVTRVCVYAKRLGIHSHLPCYPSLALGSASVNLLEMTAVYGVFANDGIYTEPLFITKIVDRYGQIVEEHLQRAWRVTTPEVAYTLTSLMESVVQQGTGQRVKALDRPAAGKTGTTNDFNDAWFIGYTPEIVAGVWVGLDDHTPLGRRETGGTVASPIWLAFMQAALEGQPRLDFPIPPGIRFERQGGKRGISPMPWDPEEVSNFEVMIDEEFISENLPEKKSSPKVPREPKPDSNNVATTKPLDNLATPHPGTTPPPSSSTSTVALPATNPAPVPRSSRRELHRLDREADESTPLSAN